MEIKFRAWDVDRKKMVPPEMLSELFLKVQCLCDVPEKLKCDSGLYLPFSEDVYMRYTGLKDKNGKEIYEGDIVVSGKGAVQVVYFNNELAAFLCCDISRENEEMGKNWVIDQEDEVIGNIYENFELLGGAEDEKKTTEKAKNEQV